MRGGGGWFPNRPYGNDGWERYAALGMTNAWLRKGGFFDFASPLRNDGWERYAALGMTCGGNNGRAGGEIGC